MRTAGQAARHSRARALAAPGFTTIRAPHGVLYLRNDLALEAPSILKRLGEVDRASDAGAGNRRGGFRLDINRQLTLFVRRARRGGVMRLLNRDIYFGWRPRPLRELATAAEAMRRAIPIAEPLGALIEPLALGFYRGAMITRALAGMTLWEFLQTDDDAYVRSHVLEQARRAISTMHRGGLFHADLNLHNLLVTRLGESFAIAILDLDQARLYPPPLKPKLCWQNLRRLVRSARKLDPDARVLSPQALHVLTGG
jgi:3-deoxy-D-manno-octulosonic acid kinase